jgi:hypothetical protein
MTKRRDARDEYCDMLVIGAGLDGRIAALQLARQRQADESAFETDWRIKRVAWVPRKSGVTQRIHWLPNIAVRVGHFIYRCRRCRFITTPIDKRE